MQQQEQHQQHTAASAEEVDEVTADGHDNPADDDVGQTARRRRWSFSEARLQPPLRFLFPAGLAISLTAFWLVVVALAATILIPLMYSDSQERYPIRLDYHNLYGYGIWLAFLLVGSGTLAMRTSHDQTVKSFIRFYVVTCLAATACLAVVVARVVYYATDAYKDIDSPQLPKRTHLRVQAACDCLALVSLYATNASVGFYGPAARRYWPMATDQQPDQLHINGDGDGDGADDDGDEDRRVCVGVGGEVSASPGGRQIQGRSGAIGLYL